VASSSDEAAAKAILKQVAVSNSVSCRFDNHLHEKSFAHELPAV